MAFFTLVAALLLDSARSFPWAGLPLQWFRRYSDRLAHDLNAGETAHGVVGWLATAGVWALAALLLFHLLHYANPVLAWLWTIAVLYFCIGFKEVVDGLRDIREALRSGELDKARLLLTGWTGRSTAFYNEADIVKAAIETGLLRVHRRVFGVIFWFILLPGPAGALLYRLAGELDERWAHRADEEFKVFGRFAGRAFHVLDWLPVRASAIGFAIAGNFEDAVSAWRTQGQSWVKADEGIVLASGAGALALRLGGPLPLGQAVDFRPDLGDGDVPDADHLDSAISLMWRTLVVWLVLLLLLTLARLVGA
jgi:cobalamin biosynthesis protein CobD/CbiB